MIDFKSDKLRRFLADVHSCAKQKFQKASDYIDEDVIRENQLFGILCMNMDSEPREYADKMNEAVGCDWRGYDIIRQFRKFHISHRQKRKELLDWAEELAIARERHGGRLQSLQSTAQGGCFDAGRQSVQTAGAHRRADDLLPSSGARRLR